MSFILREFTGMTDGCYFEFACAYKNIFFPPHFHLLSHCLSYPYSKEPRHAAVTALNPLQFIALRVIDVTHLKKKKRKKKRKKYPRDWLTLTSRSNSSNKSWILTSQYTEHKNINNNAWKIKKKKIKTFFLSVSITEYYLYFFFHFIFFCLE